MADLTSRPFAKVDFAQPVEALARHLIGATLLVDGVGGQIVETEAYDHLDPASHSFAGRTTRNAAMFGEIGCVYIYRSYGMHWCLNVVGGAEPGAAVLIRALEPQHGLDAVRARRGSMPDRALCSGPGKLCQALGVTGADDGAELNRSRFVLFTATVDAPLAQGPRVGIRRAVGTPWRFGLAGSPWLSRAF